ncbi:carbohydrate kinase family protein [Xinfangfangia pollutisoli]|uniref:carbohydrate kinase family protein n=1 Tax=Xinfangfangia pollutisoli TaxID=2865960 RepID=UPI001CD5FA7F|nr:sugar kinase [Xinfangfangia pollutisoli]
MASFDVSCVGFYVVDILGRPVTRIPEGGRADYIEEIRMTVAGTAGATALDCAILGLKTRAVSLVGQDAMGDFLVSTLEGRGVDCRCIARTDQAQTSATILPVRPNGERPALHVPGTAALFSLTPADHPAVLDARILHLGGTGLLRRFDGRPSVDLLAAAKARGLVTTFDLIQATPAVAALVAPMLPFVDWFVPSIEEARELTGLSDPAQVAQALHDQGAANVVLTLGAEGVYARAADGATLRLPAHDIRVVDTTGCGDCFTAGVITGLTKGWDLEQTLRFATAASARVAMALGSEGMLTSFADTWAAMEMLPLRAA